MTNIEAKANELYPFISAGLEYADYDMNAVYREHWTNGAEWVLSTLSGTDKEAEEVLKPYLWEGFDGSAVINAEQALEAMQEMYARGRVKGVQQGIQQYQRELQEELQKIGKLHFSIPDKEKEQYKAEIQSLQQQLSEKDKEIERKTEAFDELVEFAKEAASENQRLTAEVEAKNKQIDELIELSKFTIKP